MDAVRYAVGGTVAVLTLDAPRRNALSAAVLAELGDRLDAAEHDPAVRSVVLSHAGPVFSSGMDLTGVPDLPADRQPIVAFPALLERLLGYRKPTLARLDGKARAGGIGVLAACDVVIATPASDFAFTEVRLGLVPAVISVPVLQRMAAPDVLELCLTGETFDAGRAWRTGLVNVVTDDPDAAVSRYTDMLRLGEPGALAATKSMLRRDRAGHTVAADLARMSALSAEFFAAPPAREGVAAFAGRRPPGWAR